MRSDSQLTEHRAMALVNAEMEEAFASRGGPTSGPGMRAFGPKAANAFVRAGGAQDDRSSLTKGGSAAYVPPGRETGRIESGSRFPGSRHPSDTFTAAIPQGPSASGYSKVGRIRPHPADYQSSGSRTSSPPRPTGHGRGKRAMDSFLEEMKRCA